jgi:transposase-like protein
VDSLLLKKNKISSSTSSPPTEVSEKATRRRFTAKYKLRILEAVEACTESGEIGALLRREGLYTSHLTHWRDARRKGSLGALAPQKRGPKVIEVDARDTRIADLECDLRRATARAERAEALIALQKKVSQILGIVLPEPPDEKES